MEVKAAKTHLLAKIIHYCPFAATHTALRMAHQHGRRTAFPTKPSRTCHGAAYLQQRHAPHTRWRARAAAHTRATLLATLRNALRVHNIHLTLSRFAAPRGTVRGRRPTQYAFCRHVIAVIASRARSSSNRYLYHFHSSAHPPRHLLFLAPVTLASLSLHHTTSLLS